MTTEVHDLGILSTDILAPIVQRLRNQGCELDLGQGMRALKTVWINPRCYQQLLESMFEHMQRTLHPSHVYLQMQTRLLPRGYLCLSI